MTRFVDLFSTLPFVKVYADLPTPATVPTDVMVTAYHPDIVIYNSNTSAVALLELTCPLDSEHHLEAARSRKQGKLEYQQLLAELDHLDFSNYYETLEVSVLGHYQKSSVKNVLNVFHRLITGKGRCTANVGHCGNEMHISLSEDLYVS